MDEKVRNQRLDDFNETVKKAIMSSDLPPLDLIAILEYNKFVVMDLLTANEAD